MSRRLAVLAILLTALLAVGCVTNVPATSPTIAPSATPASTGSPPPTASPTPTPSAAPTPTPTPAPTATPEPSATATSTAAPPTPSPTASEPATSDLVTSDGSDLCPTNEELPPSYDPFTTNQDNTERALDFVFVDAPSGMTVPSRLLAAWSTFAELSFTGTAAACGVYIFSDADILDIYSWYVDTFPDRSGSPLTEVPVPPGSPGSDPQLFHHMTTDETESFNYLFRDRNVIASLTLDGPSADLGGPSSPDEVIALAATTLGRIGQSAGGSTDGAFPNAAESALLAHVPDSFRATCERTVVQVSLEAEAGVLCTTSVGSSEIEVTYQQLATTELLQEVYTDTITNLGVELDAGSCSGEWPGEGMYTIADEPAGRIACDDFAGVAGYIVWTDERLGIHAEADGFAITTEAFYEWWLSDSGPI